VTVVLVHLQNDFLGLLSVESCLQYGFRISVLVIGTSEDAKIRRFRLLTAH
jgi:hypothetical protein